MINKYLQPNDDAALVTRVFALRASGLGYQSIADDVGFTYSTVQHICHNRVYLGEIDSVTSGFAEAIPP